MEETFEGFISRTLVWIVYQFGVSFSLFSLVTRVSYRVVSCVGAFECRLFFIPSRQFCLSLSLSLPFFVFLIYRSLSLSIWRTMLCVSVCLLIDMGWQVTLLLIYLSLISLSLSFTSPPARLPTKHSLQSHTYYTHTHTHTRYTLHVTRYTNVQSNSLALYYACGWFYKR